MSVQEAGSKIGQQPVTISKEILGGIATFLTMAYIIGVQPAIMSGQMTGTPTGMDYGALLTTTCLISAAATILMGILGRVPFALAPGMGENFYIVVSVFPLCAAALGTQVGSASVWQLGLGVIFCSGLIFLLLTILKVRSALVEIINPSLRAGIGAGIGLFIAFLGFKNASLVVLQEGNFRMGDLSSPDVLIFAVGLLAILVLSHRKIPGSIFFGLIFSAVAAIFFGKVEINGIIGLPHDPRPILFNIDLAGVFRHFSVLWPIIFILTFMNIFDTLGTTLGLGQRYGLMKGNDFPRIERIFATDAISTVCGSLCGHSTMTIYMESAAGLETGARTGLASIVTGLLFLPALLFTPILTAIGNCPAVSAAVLVFIGLLMLRCITEIDWDDLTEAVPALLIVCGIMFFDSIANGIVLGLLFWPLLKILTGRIREIRPLFYPLAIALYFYVFFVL